MTLRLSAWTIPFTSLIILVASLSPTNAAQYKILISEAQIAAKKKTESGPKAWDVGLAKPDPYVIVELAGNRVCLTEKVQDAHQPRWITATGYWPVDGSTRVRPPFAVAVSMLGLVSGFDAPGQSQMSWQTAEEMEPSIRTTISAPQSRLSHLQLYYIFSCSVDRECHFLTALNKKVGSR